jgi:nucleoside-diphosphate-sugar epimerase
MPSTVKLLQKPSRRPPGIASSAPSTRTISSQLLRGFAKHEIREQHLDCTKARTWLEWAPQYSLEEEWARAVELYRDFLGIAPETAGVHFSLGSAVPAGLFVRS